MIAARTISCTALSVLAACGSDPVETRLALAESYDVVGIARVMPDGNAATELVDFRWTLHELRASGGRAIGTLTPKDRAIDLMLDGELDSATGNLQFVPMQGALTSTAIETIEQLGGTAFDGQPKNGIADDMTGFVRTIRGRRVLQGFWVAASKIEAAPAAPDPSKLRAARVEFGVARVRGEPGAVPANAAVELYVYFLAPGDARFSVVAAREDGSFTTEVDALEGDRIVIRVRTPAIVGDGVVVTVGPEEP